MTIGVHRSGSTPDAGPCTLGADGPTTDPPVRLGREPGPLGELTPGARMGLRLCSGDVVIYGQMVRRASRAARGLLYNNPAGFSNLTLFD